MELLGIFIEYPYLAFVPAVIFGVTYFRKRKTVIGITGILWLLYGLWEISIMMRITCSGDCDIRVDLLLIYPVLLVLTIISIVKTFRK